MRVAVLAGGRSSEHEFSLASGEAVCAGLEASGHEALWVTVGRDGRWRTGSEPVAIEPGGGLLGADAVFPVLHGPFGEDGTVQGLLEIAEVPYVGAGVLASALSMDKVAFKDHMAVARIPQVGYAAVREGDDHRRLERLGLPVFVKPSRLGSSVGISKVTEPRGLGAALAAAWRHDPVAIVEAMAHGIEVECSVIGYGAPEASEPGQVVAHAEWYDYDAKYRPGGMELIVHAPVAPAVRARVRELAVEVFRRVGFAALARVDFFVEGGADAGPEGVLVNELNTLPGFTATSVFAKLFEASGLPYPELVDRLVALALERHDAERRYRR